MEDKIEIADKSLTLFERTYKVLFKVTSTRFGSGFVGAVLSFAAVYFFWVETLKTNLSDSNQRETSLNNQLSQCRQEKADSYEKGRLAGKSEADKAIEAAYNLTQRISSDLKEENIKKIKKVELAEKKVQQKRKELSR